MGTLNHGVVIMGDGDALQNQNENRSERGRGAGRRVAKIIITAAMGQGRAGPPPSGQPSSSLLAEEERDNRLKRDVIFSHKQQQPTIIARLWKMEPGGEEFINSGGGAAAANGAISRRRESQQRVLPSFELQIRSDEASSASLRIATVVPGEPQMVRCSIPADSRRAFIPGTLTLHKDGRKVGRAEEGGNSIIYEFVPWEQREDGAKAAISQNRHRQTSAASAAAISAKFGDQDYHQEPQKRIIRRRQPKKKQKERKKAPPKQQKPILFHCSASVFPLEAQKRGRLPTANLYQRTMKMTPWQGHGHDNILACAGAEERGFCLNGGKCVQTEPDGIRYCLCTNGFNGRNCERLSAGLLGTMPLSTLYFSSAGFLLLLIVLVILLSGLLAREKRTSRRIRGGMKGIRLDSKDEESADTPLEDLYDTADAVCRAKGEGEEEGSPPPSLSSPSSPSPSRIPRLYSTPHKKPQQKMDSQRASGSNGYDNLEKLREEIQRQKAELEERRAATNGQEEGGTERDGVELKKSPDMDEEEENSGGSLPSSMAPSPPKRSAAYVNVMMRK